jgi:predicted nucleic acid-binding protein
MEGPSHRIVQAWLQGQAFEVVICDQLLGEARSVLTERALSEVDLVRGCRAVRHHFGHCRGCAARSGAGPALTRDPDDDYVIHLARAHDADYIVSGDADLLEWTEQDPRVVLRLNSRRD